MSSSNFFSSKQQKPQRRLGRRSLALNSTNNNTTLNGMTKPDLSFKVPDDESHCASTPLPDHRMQKENLFLSSIKPALASSHKSARQDPYQTQRVVRRLGRQSMALRSHPEEASLNDSLSRMRDINMALKLSAPKSIDPSPQPPSTHTTVTGPISSFAAPSPQPPSTHTTVTGPGSSFQASVNSFLNMFLPSSSAPAPLSSPLGSKPNDESEREDCEMTIEAVSQHTLTDVREQEDGVTHRATGSDDGDCVPHKMVPESSRMDSNYGSFLEDTSSPSQPEDSKTCLPSASGDPSEDVLNRTFDREELPSQDQNPLFKTPQAPKFSRSESLRTPLFRTPMSSVFSRFTNIDDGNDSFVENEKTIMLQFRDEMMPPVTNAPGNVTVANVCATDGSVVSCSTDASHADVTVKPSMDSNVVEKPDSPSIEVTHGSSRIEVTPATHGPSIEVTPATHGSRIEVTLNATRTTLSKLVAKQQRDLAEFRAEQERAMSEFLARQNEELNRFIVDMNVAQTQSSEVHIPLESEVHIPVESEVYIPVESEVHIPLKSDVHIPAESKVHIPLNEAEPVNKKPCQSIAFNNFRRTCPILKTPAKGNRKSCANSTAVFTPGSLSMCIRDQLEELEHE